MTVRADLQLKGPVSSQSWMYRIRPVWFVTLLSYLTRADPLFNTTEHMKPKRAYHLSTRTHQSIQFNSITMPKAQILERESAVTHDAHHSSAAAQESVARYPHDPLEASEIM